MPIPSLPQGDAGTKVSNVYLVVAVSQTIRSTATSLLPNVRF